MGILRNLIDHTAARRGATTVKPDGGDDDEVTENIWSFLCPTPFSAVTKDEIIDAIKNAYPDVHADKLWDGLQPRPLERYTKKQIKDFTALLTNIRSNIQKYSAVKEPKSLGKIKPGGEINCGIRPRGSIGGFLINDANEIFLFSDAHVLTQSINSTIGKVTASSIANEVSVGDAAIGIVVCSCQIQAYGSQNYDMALARINTDYYRKILLQYRGSKMQRRGGKSISFFVTAVDDSLSVDKRVFLFGRTTGYVEGKLLSSEPGDCPNAPYGELIGQETDENITLHGCVKVEALDRDVKAEKGDSGGLWVNEAGEAVGMQVLVQDDIAWIHPMTLVMKYFHDNYDGSLRFLSGNELTRAVERQYREH